jgi:thioredoxin reductase (NADPH)
MAFPFLRNTWFVAFASYGTETEYDNGTQVSTSGQREADMFVVLAGNTNSIRWTTAVNSNRSLNWAPSVHRRLESGGWSANAGISTNERGLYLSAAHTEAKPTAVDARAEGEIANLITQAFVWRRIGLVSQRKTGGVLFGQSRSQNT